MQCKYEITEEDGIFGIKKVYFDNEEASFGETENFITPTGSSKEEVIEILEMILKDVKDV